MKVVSAERINENRYALWVCVHFDEPIKDWEEIDDNEMETAEKLVLEYVNNDIELVKDYCESKNIPFSDYKFNVASYIYQCPDYEGGAHFELEVE